MLGGYLLTPRQGSAPGGTTELTCGKQQQGEFWPVGAWGPQDVDGWVRGGSSPCSSTTGLFPARPRAVGVRGPPHGGQVPLPLCTDQRRPQQQPGRLPTGPTWASPVGGPRPLRPLGCCHGESSSEDARACVLAELPEVV